MKTGLTVPKETMAHKLITYALSHATEDEIPSVVTAIKQLPIIDGSFNEMYGPNCKKVSWPTVIDSRV